MIIDMFSLWFWTLDGIGSGQLFEKENPIKLIEFKVVWP